MKAIVTGGLGFIGGHLSERLVELGHDVLVVDNCSTNVVDSVEGARVIRKAISEVGEPWGGAKVDVIYHLASPVGPLGVIDHKGRLALEVVADAARVAFWARGLGSTLIDVSTSEVYGSGHEDSEDDVCTFRPETSARKEYALAKLAAETMLRNSRLDVRIVRPFNVAGPRQSALGGFVLPRFISQAKRGQPLTVYLPGTQRRAFTHVADVVDGLLLVAEKGERGGVYNLGNLANVTSIEKLAREVIGLTSSSSRLQYVDPLELHGADFAEAPEKLPDAGRAMALGWQPLRGRQATILDAIEAELVARS